MPDPADPDELRGRLQRIAAEIDQATAASSRDPGAVRLLLATKTIEPARIRVAVEAGFSLIGENRVQEVVAKAPDLAGRPHETHLIGHLQSNKVNQVLPHVTCIQSVDSAELGRRLNDRIQALERTLDVFIQVNVSGEISKAGVRLDQVPALLAELAHCPALRVRGYMTVGLNSPDRAAVRAGYRALARCRDEALTQGRPGAELAVELSMGMSGDFADAIAEGATMVRLGSAVFGARPPIR